MEFQQKCSVLYCTVYVTVCMNLALTESFSPGERVQTYVRAIPSSHEENECIRNPEARRGFTKLCWVTRQCGTANSTSIGLLQLFMIVVFRFISQRVNRN